MLVKIHIPKMLRKISRCEGCVELDYWGFDPVPERFNDSEEQTVSGDIDIRHTRQIISATCTELPSSSQSRKLPLHTDSRSLRGQGSRTKEVTSPRAFTRANEDKCLQIQDLWGFDPVLPLSPQARQAEQIQTESSRKPTYCTEENHYLAKSGAKKCHSLVLRYK